MVYQRFCHNLYLKIECNCIPIEDVWACVKYYNTWLSVVCQSILQFLLVVFHPFSKKYFWKIFFIDTLWRLYNKKKTDKNGSVILMELHLKFRKFCSPRNLEIINYEVYDDLSRSFCADVIFNPRNDSYLEIIYGDRRDLVLVPIGSITRTFYRNHSYPYQEKRKRMEMVSFEIRNILAVKKHLPRVFNISEQR